MITSFTRQVICSLLALFLLTLTQTHYCLGSVIRDGIVGDTFSPYFAAFSDQMKREMVEYERLKRSLMQIHLIDWNLVAEIKAFESLSSS